MMKRIIFATITLATLICTAAPIPYREPIELRVENLLLRMTLEEKVGQVMCLMGWDSYQIDGNEVNVSEKFIKEQNEQHVGMYWAVFRADPWTQKTIDNGLNPALAAEAANAMQSYVREHSR